MAINFTAEGDVRHWPSVIATVIVAIALASSSPYGIFTYSSKDVIALVLPMAGTLVALALPAAQLAQSTLENFLSTAEGLLLQNKPIPDVRNYLTGVAKQYRRDLQATRCVVLFGLASFLVAIAGAFGFLSHVQLREWVTVPDLLASIAAALLVAAVLWFIPVVRSAFSFSKGDRLLHVLTPTPKKAPEKPPPPAPENATTAAAAAAKKS